MIVVHDETRDSMVFENLYGPGVHRVEILGNAVSALSAIIADSLLVSFALYLVGNLSESCQIRLGGVIAFGRGIGGFSLWTPSYYWQSWVRFQRPIILCIYGTYADFDLVLLPIFLTTKTNWGPYLDYDDLYWVISLVVTTASTALIVYRIVDVSKMSNNTTPYSSTIEILVESAALYTIIILICCILLVAGACRPDITWIFQVYNCLTSIQIPVAVSKVISYRLDLDSTQPQKGYCTNTDNISGGHWAS